MRFLIAGNWKMNTDRHAAAVLAAGVVEASGGVSEVDVVICPPAISLDAVFGEIHGTSVKMGAQNVHSADSGAFTGEVSVEMLKSVGCRYVIVGHSERREYFCETDESVNAKVKQAVAHGLVPIVCVGEKLSERDSGRASDVVTRQVNAGLADVKISAADELVLAYEPVWAIGTGRTASPEQAQEIHALIRKLLVEHFGDAGKDVRILYGGSMKPANAADLLQQTDVNGGLIGGASLVADQFDAIVRAAVDVSTD
ncbi:MAG: triose-phosphate isomerase [Rhodothermales bacterium]|nr:triose-phosphate isomerase [Rhodothermales bacterium]